MKTAKIFQNGQSQAVRLPKEFRLEGNEVFIKRHGNGLILLPIESDCWEIFFKNLDNFSDDFMSERGQPTDQQERDAL